MGTADNFKRIICFYLYQMRVSSGNNETQKWWFQIRVFQIISGNMSFYMMHSN